MFLNLRVTQERQFLSKLMQRFFKVLNSVPEIGKWKYDTYFVQNILFPVELNIYLSLGMALCQPLLEY